MTLRILGLPLMLVTLVALVLWAFTVNPIITLVAMLSRGREWWNYAGKWGTAQVNWIVGPVNNYYRAVEG